MASVLVKDILDQAALQLEDPNHTRWSIVELVRYLEAAQRDVVARLPNANTYVHVLTLVKGSRQELPAHGTLFIKCTAAFQHTSAPYTPLVINNAPQTFGPGVGQYAQHARRDVEFRHVVTAIPNYQKVDPDNDAMPFEYAKDDRSRKVFWVIPAVGDTTRYVEVVYQAAPLPLHHSGNLLYAGDPPKPNTNDTGTGVYDTTVIGLDDIYSQALFSFVMWQARSRNMDIATGKSAREWYAEYMASVGQQPAVLDHLDPKQAEFREQRGN